METVLLVIGTLGMGLGTAYFAYLGTQSTGGSYFYWITAAITGFAFISYLAMASGAGSTILDDGREFYFFRYLDWLVTKTLIEDEPGRETAITSGAVKQLAEAAAREAGATSPSCSLATDKSRYDVACDIRVPGSENFTELATRARDNIQRVLEEQQVPVKDIEVTVQGTAPQG